jgi:hypothetical protein
VIKSHAHWSLKRRLAIRLLAVLTFGVLGPSSVIVITAMWAINSMDDRALQDQAADIARNLDVSVDPPVLRLPEQLAASYRISNESYLYAVFWKDNGIVAASSDTASILLTAAMHQGQDRFFAISQDGHRWPLYAYSTTKGPYKIAVAQGSLHRDALSDSIIRRLANFTVLTSLPLLAVTLLVAIWTLNRAFGAIERVASEATAITPGGAEAKFGP